MVVEHGKRAIQQADLLIFVVDGRDGRVTGDDEIAAQCGRRARRCCSRSTRPTTSGHATACRVLRARLRSRVRGRRRARHRGPRPARRRAVSSKAAGKVGGAVAVETPDEIAVAIVGRPNVGKSSLVNRLLREERLIVSDMPGHDPRRHRHAPSLAQAHVPHRRYRRYPAARPGGQLARHRDGERADRQARHGTRRRRGARDRRVAGRHRPGRRHRRRGRASRLRHDHRRQQVGPRRRARATATTRNSTRSSGSA